MSRFANLEFEDGKQRQDEMLPPGEVRDERHYLKLADENFRSARFRPALQYYSRALEYNVNVVDGWFGQVRMLIELGDYKEARLWADKALEIFRNHSSLLAAKAVAFAREGDGVKAQQFSDAALSQKGHNSYVWMARGEVLLATKQPNDEWCFSKARAFAPGKDWFLLLDIARSCYFYRSAAKALNYARQALELQGTSVFAWCVLADCQMALGLTSAAEQSYGQALSFDRSCQWASAELEKIRNRGVCTRLADAVRHFFQRDS